MIVTARRAAAVLQRAFAAHATDGDVLVPANVCAVVPLALRAAGRRVRFVDLDPVTLEVDAAVVLAQAGAGGVAGLVFVRPYGALRDVEPFFAALKARAPRLLLVDDRCLGRPALRAPATQADLTLYSTGRAKYVDLGGGGYAFARVPVPLASDAPAFDPAAWSELEGQVRAAERTRTSLAEPRVGWLDLRPAPEGWRAQAARLRRARARADARRHALGRLYRDGVLAMAALSPALCTWRFNLLAPQAEELRQSLADVGVPASRHFAPTPALFGDDGNYPVAQALAERVVNLFFDPPADKELARRAVDGVRAHLVR